VHDQKLRLMALKCLEILPRSVPYSVLHSHKAVVITKLADVLGDPKKQVRREAVDARWVEQLEHLSC
jgi:DNA repair/transcription protein MET18/MMS19